MDRERDMGCEHDALPGDLSVFEGAFDALLFEEAEDLYRIGRLYALGRGRPVDLPTGYVWLRVAAARGSRSAARLMQEISAEMERSELARAKAAWRRATGRAAPPGASAALS